MKLMLFVNPEVMYILFVVNASSYENYDYFMILGKSDQSAAGVAYDSLVNQLLTLMDGLRSASK